MYSNVVDWIDLDWIGMGILGSVFLEKERRFKLDHSRKTEAVLAGKRSGRRVIVQFY